MSHIIVLIDKSGSMKSNATQLMNGFNEFLQSQKKIVDETVMTLLTFSDEVEIVFEKKLISDVDELTSEEYNPNGMTALNDAIGKALTDYCDNPRTLVVVLTDGEENSSVNFTPTQIEALVSTRTVEGWKLIYLCNDMVTARAGNSIGLGSATIGSRNPSTQNLVAPNGAFGTVLARQVSSATSSYRTKSVVDTISDLTSGVSHGQGPAGTVNMPPLLRRTLSSRK